MKHIGFISAAFLACISLVAAGANRSAAAAPEQEARWLSYFPSTYTQSRARFREDCKQHLASPDDFCRSETIASPTDADLTVDYGFFGRGGDRLVVIQSGIHGSEAIPGAAVEKLVLNEYLDKLLDHHIDVLVIHALNPYGFKYVRRADDHNVNLNRNFAVKAQDYDWVNPDYAPRRGLFEPAGPVKRVWLSSLAVKAQFIGRLIADGGSKLLNNGFNSGQYDYPNGINFGGKAPTRQVTFLKNLLHPFFERPYRKILFLDFHTGLGPNGELGVIEGIQPSAGPLGELKQVWGPLKKDGVVFRNPKTEKGYFETKGDVIDFVPNIAAPADPRVLALTMEYGTMGLGVASQLESASRMILENRAHFYPCPGDNKAPCDQIRSDFRDMFSPPDQAWRVKIMREADLTFTALLNWKG